MDRKGHRLQSRLLPQVPGAHMEVGKSGITTQSQPTLFRRLGIRRKCVTLGRTTGEARARCHDEEVNKQTGAQYGKRHCPELELKRDSGVQSQSSIFIVSRCIPSHRILSLDGAVE